MKRVSDALRRAQEENVRADKHDRGSAHEWVQEVFPEHKSHGATNGGPPPPPTVGKLQSKSSYRNRVEELVFGRDLKDLKEFPLVALEIHSAAAEQYKILREQVRKICSERSANVLLVTSPVKGDGKTKVTANLAVALALDYEEQVLVIDADMRNPSLYSYFGGASSPGLSAFLASESEKSPMHFIQQTNVQGLSILPAGDAAAQASELLTTEKMKRLLEALRLNFPGHRILIDSAPVLSTPDPLVLSRHVDGILLIVRAGQTPRDYVSKAIKTLDTPKIFGVILNGAEMAAASRYYYHART
jgi:capsular exopolysaccharide synthesis family protein